MTLDTQQFVRRFCLHVLPHHFVKIRHYGLLGNRKRQQRLECARQLLGALPQPMLLKTSKETGAEPAQVRCPFCGRPTLVWVREVAPSRKPPPVATLDSS